MNSNAKIIHFLQTTKFSRPLREEKFKKMQKLLRMSKKSSNFAVAKCKAEK